MKVILTKDVKELGKAGELVKAKSGYARNFLIPKGYAVEATAKNKKIWKEEQKELAAKRAKEEAEAEKLKKKLESSKVVLLGKAGEGGRLFGSVTSKDIAKGLKEQYDIDIDRRKIELEDNIKDLGVTTVDVRVYPEVVAKLKVDVKVQ